MAEKLHWSDAQEIGYRLFERHPDIDPLTLRFTDLHSSVTKLDRFEDDPAASNEKILEAILMAWVDERED